MVGRVGRSSLLQELTRVNRWWADPSWQDGDPQLRAARSAPYQRRPAILDDIAPPNLYTLRGPRRVGKSTLLKQTVARLCESGVDPRRICHFPADAIDGYRDLINLFQTARQLFPDLGDAPRYFLIDEITAVREWQRGIKWLRDNSAVEADCIVVSGSSAGDIAEGATHLAGRRGPSTGLDRLLLPMSFPEFARCAGYQLPRPPRLPLASFYDESGRAACRDALLHLDTLIPAFEAYLLVGGFPQAVSEFRRTASVSAGFARDLWDVVQSDLRREGVSRPEQVLLLLEQLATGIASPTSMRNVASRLGIDSRTAGAWIDALANSYMLLVLFKESSGVPDVNSLRKLYPVDPLVARLPALHSPGVYEPNDTQLAEAALALALYRSVEGQAVDRFRQPGRLFYYRSRSNTEIDFLVLPDRTVLESKYIDTADRREVQAMLSGFGEGLLLTRSGIDIHAPGGILPISVFDWLLDQGE